ncbi:FkbM family methyltransferase [Nocardioides plantarum]|uniref:FkbM family methyltransferase n=1 Tax=Nocardioides plantarum TaxID=29299 RepID=A0ABV5K6F0_9ACTN|nr:FkbM family methyltransferase [Nocardioides plantarum]
MTPIRERVQDAIPPRIAMRLRAEKNRRALFGLHAPARVLVDMVPQGCVAVDAGANAGLYAYWIARNAATVHAFEPQPRVFDRLRASAPGNVTCHNVALSDARGTAQLHIPATGNGEASLHELGRETEVVDVPTRTLDSFNLNGVGFLKIDVEGHEEALLRGAMQTIRDSRPAVFIEIEERHNPGGIARIADLFASLDYSDALYMAEGQFRPLSSFDPDRHQTPIPTDSPRYANNFLFRAS